MRTQPGANRAEAEKETPAADGRSAQAENNNPPLTITVSLPRKVSP
jgi:hypothetical protein